jgi:3-oxoacyl-[acyl-carrier-protein] synthase III
MIQNSRRCIQIEGTASFLPQRLVSAAEMDGLLGMTPGWTAEHTGVLERYFVMSETAAEMGAAAIRRALAASGRRETSTAQDAGIDLLLCASGTPQQIIPCSAALIARELGWSGLACMDLNATCLGFLAALDLSASLLLTGRYQRIVVVCSEIASKGLNWSQPEAAALMGDGAGAVIVSGGSPGASGEVWKAHFETWPEGAEFTRIKGGGNLIPATEFEKGVNDTDFLFHMDGPSVFKLVAKKIDSVVSKLIGSTLSRWDEIDLVVPHQGSLAAMRLLGRRLGLPAEKLMHTASHTGNTIAAALPIALDRAITTGRLHRGDKLMFLGTGAGLSIGGLVLTF